MKEREELRKSRKREIEREFRLERAGKKKKIDDRTRDVSEQIALGMAGKAGVRYVSYVFLFFYYFNHFIYLLFYDVL